MSEELEAGGGPKTTGSGLIQVNRMYKKGKILTKEEAASEVIEVPGFTPGAAVAKVGFGTKTTINLENYESVSISVFAEFPSYLSETGDAFDAVKMFVDSRLNQEVSAVREYLKTRTRK